jgi:hypothetical protein
VALETAHDGVGVLVRRARGEADQVELGALGALLGGVEREARGAALDDGDRPRRGSVWRRGAWPRSYAQGQRLA